MPETHQSTASAVAPRTAADWPWALALFLAILGAKLWLIDCYGTSLPFWDQWEDAFTTYLPWVDGKLTWSDLISPHNEHRIFFTRVYGLVLLLLNGQWDNRLQMAGNAVLHAGTMTALGWGMARLLGRRAWPWLALVLGGAAILPFAWENTLAGFHSQFYFMLGFSLAALWLLGLHSWRSCWWWAGVGAAFAALFTVASGVIVAGAVFTLAAWRVFLRRERWRELWPTMAVGVLVAVAGVLLKAEVPHHQILKAHSLAEFLVSLGKALAWPWIVLPPYAVVNMLPLGLLAWRCFRSDEKPTAAAEMTLGLGLWAVLQCAASAYARGAGGAHPQWRYMDTTCFVMIVNALSLVVLWMRHSFQPPWKKRLQIGTGLWSLAAIGGMVLLTARAWTVDIPERDFNHRAQWWNARVLLATDEPRQLYGIRKEQLARFEGMPGRQSPENHAAKLAEVLREPRLRAWLPAETRDRLNVTPASNVSRAFDTNGLPAPKPEPPGETTWGSYSSSGAEARGLFESQPIRRSRLPYLEIPVAGQLGSPGLSLELVDISSGHRQKVRPSTKADTSGWCRAYVKAPAGEFKIIAQDDSGVGWLAFKEPRELGRLSLWTLWALAAGRWIFFAALVVLLTLAWRKLRGRSPELQD